jgi:SAM-dependent methyltransferase
MELSSPKLSSPRIGGAPDSHGTIRDELRARTPCKVLDAGCGEGALASYLQGLGWDVHCADIDRESFKVDAPFTPADLNKTLPFDDASFDAVICANTLHRLYNPAGAIRELHRILRPGGHLYINLNNYATVDLRLRYLLFGSIESRDPVQDDNPAVPPEGRVRIHITYYDVASRLEATGFKIVAVKPAAVRPRHRLFAVLGWLVRAATRFIPRRRRERNHVDVTASRAVLTGGYYIFIDALKP